MAALKFLNLLAISTLAILAASPASASLGDSHLAARHAHHHHARTTHNDSFSKRALERRSDAVRCRAPRGDGGNNQEQGVPSDVSSIIPTATSSSASGEPTGDNNGGTNDNPIGSLLQSKTGIAWPNGDANPIDKFKPLQGGLYYTWSPSKVSKAADSGLQFAAQLWGWNQVDQFQDLVNTGYADIILGMNEPNDKGQSNMSPESGAELWMKYIEPLKSQGYYLVSPACTSAPSGIEWIQDWLKACDGGCNPDAIAAHYYDTSADRFIEFVKNYHDTFNKDVWITEFACQNFNGGAQCSMDDIWNFMVTTVQWMDKTDWVKFYAWFGIMEDMQNVNPLNRLMDEDGSDVTDLGRWYLGDHQ